METSYTPCMGYEKLTVTNAVKQLTVTKYKAQLDALPDLLKTAKTAVITSETDSIRYTFDGTDPVAATTGHLLLAGSVLTVHGYANIAKLKMIRVTADATIHVSYFGG